MNLEPSESTEESFSNDDPASAQIYANVTLSSRTLLKWLAAPNHPMHDDAWMEIDHRYRPLVIGFGRRMGLSPRHAESAAQATMSDFALAVRGGTVDIERGTPRKLLFGIARHKVLDYLRRDGTLPPTGSCSIDAAGGFPGPDELEAAWEREEHIAITRCIEEQIRIHFRERDVTIFWARVKQGLPSKTVAERLDTNVNAIDQVVHKIRRFCRDIGPRCRDGL